MALYKILAIDTPEGGEIGWKNTEGWKIGSIQSLDNAEFQLKKGWVVPVSQQDDGSIKSAVEEPEYIIGKPEYQFSGVTKSARRYWDLTLEKFSSLDALKAYVERHKKDLIKSLSHLAVVYAASRMETFTERRLFLDKIAPQKVNSLEYELGRVFESVLE